MQAGAVEPLASSSRLSEAAPSLIAAAHSHAIATPLASQRLPIRRNGSAQSDDGDDEDGDAAHKYNKVGDKEKEKKRRTRNGCLVCRKRKKLCDEQKPTCGACSRLSLACAWEDRVQAALERRRRRIERMKLKEQDQGGGGGAPGVSLSSSSSKPRSEVAKRKPGKHQNVDVPGVGGWDQQAAAVEMMQLDPLAYHPAAPGIYPPTSPPVSFQQVNSLHETTTTAAAAIITPVEGDPPRGAPLDSSSHSWMPFLGSFAPAGYEPAAAPDPLAWSMSWPVGMGYSPYMTAMAVGGGVGGGGGSIVGQPPPGQHYLPAIGATAPAAQPLTAGETPAAVQADPSARPSAAERDELDLDALAQLEQVQSDLLLQSNAAADAGLIRTSSSQGEEPFPAVTATAAAPNGSSPPFDLFALLRSPSPVHPFATAAGASVNAGPAGVPFAFDPWGSAAVTSPIKLHPSSSVSQHLSASSGTSVERGRQLQVGVKSLPATVGHAASFLASSDWAFTQAYLLSHYTSSLARLVSIASSPAASDSSSSGSGGSDRSRGRRGGGRLSEQRQHFSSRPSSSHSRPRDSATARSTRASANLFLSLVPLANRHPYLLHAILSWSAANLAAASSSSNSNGGGGGSAASGSTSAGGNSIMAILSDQLGHLADEEISAALPELEAYAARRANARCASVDGNRDRDRSEEETPPGNWEVLLAARLMLTQAAICQGAVDLWRVRLGEAAHVIDLVGGVAKCRTPLARQLVKNLLYHDVLSSTSRRDGLLLDYSFLRQGGGGGGGGGMGATPGSTTTTSASGTSPATAGGATPTGETEEERRRREAEEDEEDVLDTLMGCAESVFLLVGRITSLAKEKRESLLASTGGGVPEDKLDDFMRQVDELRIELEREKERMDAFLIERPDLEPHRYFHEVFRLAALVYLHMLLELPPTSYPILLFVRKMLSLGMGLSDEQTEVIVSEGLPGLCSMHWPLFLMHLNSTPLVSPHAPTTSTTAPASSSSSSGPNPKQQTSTTSPPPPPPPRAQAEPPGLLSDRARSTALFDAHMHEFTFMNTKRSRLLIDEAWRRSQGGSRFVDPDWILDEWEWDLNWA